MLLSSPDEYLYQLQASNKADAIRLWRKAIKEAWNNCCAYCGENKDDNRSCYSPILRRH